VSWISGAQIARSLLAVRSACATSFCFVLTASRGETAICGWRDK
jgi:hypothetical protein